MAGLKFARTFSLPLKKARNPLLTLFPHSFIVDQWSPCSASCGEGIRFRKVHYNIIIVIVIIIFTIVVIVIIISTIRIIAIVIIMMASRRWNARFSLSFQKLWQACLTRYLMIINNDINNHNNDNNNCIDTKSLQDRVFIDNQ